MTDTLVAGGLTFELSAAHGGRYVRRSKHKGRDLMLQLYRDDDDAWAAYAVWGDPKPYVSCHSLEKGAHPTTALRRALYALKKALQHRATSAAVGLHTIDKVLSCRAPSLPRAKAREPKP